jgi:hypothetical protein
VHDGIVDPQLLFMIDEAWFHVSGHVSAQNVRIWSDEVSAQNVRIWSDENPGSVRRQNNQQRSVASQISVFAIFIFGET